MPQDVNSEEETADSEYLLLSSAVLLLLKASEIPRPNAITVNGQAFFTRLDGGLDVDCLSNQYREDHPVTTNLSVNIPSELERLLDTRSGDHAEKVPGGQELDIKWPIDICIANAFPELLAELLGHSEDITSIVCTSAFKCVHDRLDEIFRGAAPITVPSSVLTLDVTASFLRTAAAPRPPLVALSLSLSVRELQDVYTLVAHYGATLRQLRLMIRSDSMLVVRAENPARICAKLSVPRLEYLEVHEVPSFRSVRTPRRILA